MWTLSESLVGTFMIFVGFIFIIIARKIALLFRQDVDLSEINDAHHWSDLDTLLKTYSCYMCYTCLSGSCGKQCDNCGIYCHDTCIKAATKAISCKDIYSLPSEKQNLKHHWIEDGNLMMDCDENDETFCCICDEECVDAESSISQCCWCQRIRHSKCFPNEKDCDFGKLRPFVIPPFCIVPTKPSRFNRKFKLKYFSHPGWKPWTPVIVLANRRSGNSDGAYILSRARRLLNPCQVLDLGVHSPSLILKWCSTLPLDVTLYILVAGGDGTVAWVLNTLSKYINAPPIAIIPLGTGNDLSRILGWGKAYSRELPLTKYLDKIPCCDVVDLDRWRINVKSLRNISIPRRATMYCYNYFSVGVDAKVALDFHLTRQTSPLYLSSRLCNKLLYTVFGTRQVVAPDCVGLQNRLKLYLDGVEITSIPEIESIVVANIPSWAAGVKLWNHVTNPLRMLPQKIDDGKLEVVGIYSSFHIAQLQIGLSEPHYIGQAAEVKIVLSDALPVQADGEPWIQSPAEITISLCNKAKVLKMQ